MLAWLQDQHPSHAGALQKAFIKHAISGRSHAPAPDDDDDDAGVAVDRAPARARASSRPCAAQAEGSPPGAPGPGRRGAAAGGFAGAASPACSRGDERPGGPPLW